MGGLSKNVLGQNLVFRLQFSMPKKEKKEKKRRKGRKSIDSSIEVKSPKGSKSNSTTLIRSKSNSKDRVDENDAGRHRKNAFRPVSGVVMDNMFKFLVSTSSSSIEEETNMSFVDRCKRLANVEKSIVDGVTD